MEDILITLKRFLNSIDDRELKDIEFWVDGCDIVNGIILDSNSISLITDMNKLKYDGKDW